MTQFTPFPWIDVAIILALVLLNGVFAMSELAIVSARPARLEALAVAGFRKPQVRQTLENIGFEVMGLPSQDFARFIAAETARWGGLIRRLDIQAD